MSKKIQKLIDRMTIEQKVGQLLVFGFNGTYAYPDVIEAVEKFNVAGFRVVPTARKFKRYLKEGHPGIPRVHRPFEYKEKVYFSSLPKAPYLSAAEYADVLNSLRRKSLKSGAGIPLYFAIDSEGDQSLDFCAPGLWGFPSQLGLAVSGNPSLSRRVGEALARELRAIGINTIHSPNLDVKTNPHNSQVGVTSFSPIPEVVSKYAVESMLGLLTSGFIPVAKHFPGLGAAKIDAHFDVPEIEESYERMMNVHIAPYKALIDKGLPSLMLAHAIYPALDPTKEIATVSEPIVTGVLREKLGFNGVIITDSFSMGGLVAKYEIQDAAIRAIKAGVDLILLKDESALRGEVYYGILDAVRAGKIKEERVNESIMRVLKMKEKMGLFDKTHGLVEVSKADKRLSNPLNARVAKEAARKAILQLRMKKGILPVKKGTKVLVLEEFAWAHNEINDSMCHVGSLFESLADRGLDATIIDFDKGDYEKIRPTIKERAQLVDMIIYTGHFQRGELVPKPVYTDLESFGKEVIFVTNSPYPEAISADMKNVIVTFSSFTPSMQAAADVITGRSKAVARLAFDPEKAY